MIKCVYCNFENSENAVFCNFCGHRLKNQAENITETTNTIATCEKSSTDVVYMDQKSYSLLKRYSDPLYNTIKTAERLIDIMPHQAIKKVFIVLETLARDYYIEAVARKDSFSAEDLLGQKPKTNTKDNISEIVNELEAKGLISDEIKTTFLNISKTRNDIDYGSEDDLKRITKQTARNIYASGEIVSEYFIYAIENSSQARFDTLKANYRYLYRKALDATKLIESNDAFATVDELGNLLRGLCCELYAQYKNINVVRSVKYSDAIKLLSDYRFISKDAEDTICDIVKKRNLHHSFEGQISETYAKNALKVTSRLTVYLVDKIDNAASLRDEVKTYNTKKYNEIIKYFLENYAETFSTDKITFCFDTKIELCENFIYQEYGTSRGMYHASKYDNSHKNIIFIKYPELYLFSDYLSEYYPAIPFSTQEKSDNQIKTTIMCKDLMKIPAFNNAYEKYKSDIVNEKEEVERWKKLKEEQARKQRQLEAEQEQRRKFQYEIEQRRLFEETQARQQFEEKKKKRMRFLFVIIPVAFYSIIASGVIISENVKRFVPPVSRAIFGEHHLNYSFILWLSILYIILLLFSKKLHRLGAGTILFGLLICIPSIYLGVVTGLNFFTLNAFLCYFVWIFVLWIFLFQKDSFRDSLYDFFF